MKTDGLIPNFEFGNAWYHWWMEVFDPIMWKDTSGTSWVGAVDDSIECFFMYDGIS